MIQIKRYFFAFVLLFFSSLTTHSLFAQGDFTKVQKVETEVEYEYDTIIVKRKVKRKLMHPDYKKGNLDFYLSPLALLELCPTAYFGVEYFLKNKISVYTDMGYIFSIRGEDNMDGGLNLPHSSYPNYVIKPEIRFYTKNNPQKSSYRAIKFMFRNMNYREEQFVYDEYFFDTNTQNWTVSGTGYESDYRVRRRSIGVQYVRGWKSRFTNKGTTNFYFGVGIRYISNNPIDKRPNPFNDSWNRWSVEYLGLEKKYTFVTIDMSLGLRIGAKLKKR